MEVIESLFKKALNIKPPWQVKKVEFNEEEKKLKIFIDFPRGSVFSCPKCGEGAKGYDMKEKIWRHLNFFQYECDLVVRVPRIECGQDSILQVEVP